MIGGRSGPAPLQVQEVRSVRWGARRPHSPPRSGSPCHAWSGSSACGVSPPPPYCCCRRGRVCGGARKHGHNPERWGRRGSHDSDLAANQGAGNDMFPEYGRRRGTNLLRKRRAGSLQRGRALYGGDITCSCQVTTHTFYFSILINRDKN